MVTEEGCRSEGKTVRMRDAKKDLLWDEAGTVDAMLMWMEK